MKKGLALLLLIHFILLLPVVTGKKVFFLRDVFHYYYPIKGEVINLWKAGEMPLWDESIFLGNSLVGDPLTGVFDPYNLVYLLVPFDTGFQGFFVVHILLFAAGLFFLILALGGSAIGACLGALTLSLSPGFLFLTTQSSFFGAYCLVPWFALTFIRLLQEPCGSRASLMALVIACQLLKSEPQTVYLEGLLSFGVLAWRAFDRHLTRSQVLFTVACWFLVVGLGACQILPSLEFLSHSVRASGMDVAAILSGSLHPYRFLEYLVPYPWGNPLAGETYAPPFLADTQLISPWVLSNYLGLPVIVGTPLLFSLKKTFQMRPVRICLALALFFILLALGKYLPWFYRFLFFVPGWKLFRTPEKFVFFAHVSFCVALGLIWSSPQNLRRFFPEFQNASRILWAAMIALQVLSLLRLSTVSSLIREESFYQTPALVQTLRAQVNTGRLYFDYNHAVFSKMHFLASTSEQWRHLRPNVGSLYGLSYLAGYSSAVPASFVEIWDHLQKDPNAHFNLYNVRFLASEHPEKLPLKNFREVTQDGSWHLLENLDSLPKYFVVASQEPPVVRQGRFGEKVALKPSVPVTVERRSNHERHLEIEIPEQEPCWLVWSENLDSGWHASRNGVPQTIVHLYPGLQGLALGAGKNRIQMDYAPAYFSFALGISIVSAIFSSVLLFCRRFRPISLTSE